MYARVLLTIEERKDTALVPKIAVVDFEGKRGVWIPGADNKVQFREAKLGLEDPERIEVLDGVKPGDRIVTEGAGSLRAGDTVVLPGQDAGGPGGGGPGGGRGAGGQGRAASQPGQQPGGGAAPAPGAQRPRP
jgi:multidrug efflux system membrane fusion protein